MNSESNPSDEFDQRGAAFSEVSEYDHGGMSPGERQDIVDEALTMRLEDADERARNYLLGKRDAAIGLFAVTSAVAAAMAIRGYIRKEK